jgi:uncharacterized protein (DUF2141 family)
MRLIVLAAVMAHVAIPVAVGGELVVEVTGIRSAVGEIGCAVHRDAASFPTGNAGVVAQWHKPAADSVTCRFGNLQGGGYAVAASHDLNGNRKTDTNFLGMPTEDWGVSNNVRLRLSAPTFDEAKVDVADNGETRIQIRLGR